MTTTKPANERAGANADAPAVRTELVGHVLLVTIDRPEARNAVNLAVASGLGAALEYAEREISVRSVVLTGAGDRAFCAGADLKAIARGEPVEAGPTEGQAATWGFAGYVRHHISKPTIAAVNGVALGGGTELVLASDLAVAAASARFGLPEVTHGLIAGGGGLLRLPRTVSHKAAMELILTGDVIDAEAALDLGLINRIVPDHEVLNAAMALAGRIAGNAPLAVQASKRVAYAMVDGAPVDEAALWHMSDQADVAMRASQDAAEGAAAFIERRAPIWKGC
jgi:crotonobetainyl-CoA hydratase